MYILLTSISFEIWTYIFDYDSFRLYNNDDYYFIHFVSDQLDLYIIV